MLLVWTLRDGAEDVSECQPHAAAAPGERILEIELTLTVGALGVGSPSGGVGVGGCRLWGVTCSDCDGALVLAVVEWSPDKGFCSALRCGFRRGRGVPPKSLIVFTESS